ncbi:hypothetical protein SPRG_13376 [Saprolegnia parasitica CBS 223.65]|uniref:Anaphase-promoting complex subunit 5 n=1 Tax=Saprolegnia parasitica (strain CBS 223.65) TaxID=695850 RepID=A0A067BXI3_SAPPC|nr:hypothetical protein SPRG_13376 [Saprolegnia parasitica CBS 223.65]KDO21565.1 hypothetical protein SPRG_13376 [Saprolegnia parasitica CBS 223.65]|eukprot:XP_012207742.1 hypothetical protein SPRG_13376 [Saprolegnia parasitica CBS 223.65]
MGDPQLAELSAPNVCVGYLIARFAAEFHAHESALFVSSSAAFDSRQHELAALLLERVTAIALPLPFDALVAAVAAIDTEWALALESTMTHLSQSSIDDVDDFLRDHLQPTSSGLDPSSPLGRFLRMLALASSTAFFDRMCRFQLELRAYVTSRSQSTCDLPLDVDDLLESLDAGRADQPLERVEACLSTQLQRHPSCPRLLFARYLNFKVHREYLGALHALHAYHDHALRTFEHGFGPQYATLNLVGLYSSFGYRDEALSALHETLRVAQHKRDGVCVAYALAWYMQLFPASHAQSRQCVDRAGDLGLTALAILAGLLSSVHADVRESFTTPAPRPIAVWLRLQQIACELEAAATTRAPKAAALPGLHQKTETPIPLKPTTWTTAEKDDIVGRWAALRGAIALTTAGVWHDLGHRTLTHLHTQLYGLCYASSSADIALAMRRIALLQMDPTSASPSSSSLYASSLRWLATASAKWHVQHEPAYIEAVLHVLFEWSFARGQWRRATHCQQLLMGLAGAKTSARVEATLLQVRLFLYQQERYLDAANVLQALLPTAKEHPPLHAKALLLLAHAYVLGAPDAPFEALPPLLHCLQLCDERALDSVRAHAHLVLAALYLHMDRWADAASLLEAAVPQVQEHGGLHLQGQYALALAKTHMVSNAPTAIAWLGQALTIATRRDDVYLEREASYLLALAAEGDEREAAAERFVKVDAAVQAAREVDVDASLHPLGPDLLGLVAHWEDCKP